MYLSLLAVFCRGSVFSSGSHAERRAWPESGAYKILHSELGLKIRII